MTNGQLHGIESPGSYDHMLYTPDAYSSPMVIGADYAKTEAQPGNLIQEAGMTNDTDIATRFVASCIAPEIGVYRAPSGDDR